MIIYKHDYILENCKDKVVLHIGATDFPYHIKRVKTKELLHYKLNKISKKVVGIDNAIKAIEDLKRFNINNIYYGDIVLNKYEREVLKQKYDIILIPDVLEHLTNPGLALRNIKKFCNKNIEIIITVPNVWSIFHIKNHFTSKEKVHPDHCFWPSLLTMSNLIKKSGFRIIKRTYALSGASNNPHGLKGKIFKRIILDKYEFLGPVLIFKVKLNEDNI